MVDTTTSLSQQALQDENLPRLEVALDADYMKSRFAEAASRLMNGSPQPIHSCAIERIQHRRGQRCKILYRVSLSPDQHEPHTHWFSAKMVKRGKGAKELQKMQKSLQSLNGESPPILLLDDLDMVIWGFPYDPAMPRLHRAANKDMVLRDLNSRLKSFGFRSDWKARHLDMDKVKYMPGKRCVLRFHASLTDAGGNFQIFTFYNKTYSDGKGRYHFRYLQIVYKNLYGRVNVPRPLCYIDASHSFWQEPWHGSPLIDCIREQNWRELFPRLAEVVANLHKSRSEGYSNSCDFSHVVESAREDAQMLQWLLPEHRERLQRCFEILVTARKFLAESAAPCVPVHNALRIEQFLVRDKQFALVDFDAVALGDPLFDIAEFVTSLHYLAYTTDLPLQRLRDAGEHFLRQYQNLVPWEVDNRRIAWYAVAFLFGKLHDTVKNLDFPALHRIDRILESIENWSGQLSAWTARTTGRNGYNARKAIQLETGA